MHGSEMLSRRGHDAGPLALRMDSACQARSRCGTATRGDKLSGSVVAVPTFVDGRSLRSPGRLDYHAARKRCRFAPLFSSVRPLLSRNASPAPADVPAPTRTSVAVVGDLQMRSRAGLRSDAAQAGSPCTKKLSTSDLGH